MRIDSIDFNAGRRISLEIGTPLQIEVEGIDVNLKSTLIGIDPEKYLIINAPGTSLYGSIKHKFYRGNKIIVRYLYGGSVFGFQSEFIEDIYPPLRLLFLKYPKIIEEHNLRSQERHDCFLPAKITLGGEERDGVILDINMAGCLCVIKRMVEGKDDLNASIDDDIIFSCQFPQVQNEHLISGKVKSIRGDTNQLALGGTFEEIKPEVEGVLKEFIRQIKELPKIK